jgi:hypothetical protein
VLHGVQQGLPVQHVHVQVLPARLKVPKKGV